MLHALLSPDSAIPGTFSPVYVCPDVRLRTAICNRYWEGVAEGGL